MSAKSFTIVGSVLGQLVELVYTYVLGTYSVRIESSSLSLPTKGYVECYVTDTLVTLKRKGVLVVLGFIKEDSLRNYRHTFNHITGGNYNCYYSSFFKNLTFALVRWSRIQTYQNQRIHTQVINKNRRMFTLCPTY